jgi:nitrile hydratase accessory protein
MNDEEMNDEDMLLTEAITPPMANGEVIFDEPWQSRIFGMARVLCEQGQFEWNEFRDCLINRISQWEDLGKDEPYLYFDHFLAALTDVVAAKGICPDEELRNKTELFAARPHGHDH